MSTIGDAESDRLLVNRCLDGDEAAWKQLYQQCQPGLLHLIRSRLNRRADDLDLAEEVAAAVWSSLLDRDSARLRHFDPVRGCRFLTYLAALARFEIRRLRGPRTGPGPLPEIPDPQPDRSDEALLNEFLATLTPRERQFCESHLLASGPPTHPAPFSQANAWQLRHRVRRKILQFARTD